MRRRRLCKTPAWPLLIHRFRTDPKVPSREEARLAQTASFLLDREVDWSREATRVWVDGVDGTVEAVLPTSSIALLVRALHEMRTGQGTDVVPYRSELTTQEAADLLGVSRPHVVMLLESGAMPFWKVGNRRRVLLEDVLAYRRQTRGERDPRFSPGEESVSRP